MAPKVEIVTIGGKKYRKRTHYKVVNTTTERVEMKTFDIPITENSTNESVSAQLKEMMKREEECNAVATAPLQVPIIIPKDKNRNILKHHKGEILSKDAKQTAQTITGASAAFKQKVKMMLMKDPKAKSLNAKQRSLSVGAKPLSDGTQSEDIDDEDETSANASIGVAINTVQDMCTGMVSENEHIVISEASQAIFSDINQLKSRLKPLNQRSSPGTAHTSVAESSARSKVTAQNVAREISASLQQGNNEIITANFKQQHEVFIAPSITNATTGDFERHSFNTFSTTKSIMKNSEDDIVMKKTEKSVKLSFSIGGINVNDDAVHKETNEPFSPSKPLILKSSPANSFSSKQRSFKVESPEEEPEEERRVQKEITDANVKDAIKLIDVFLAASTTASRVEGSLRRPPLPKTAVKMPTASSIAAKEEPARRSISDGKQSIKRS